MEPVTQAIARRPVTAFLIIGYAAAVAAALIPPLREAELPFGAPVYASVGTFLGVGLAAFLVTAAADGRAGVRDLLRRTFRWRVPVHWYAITLLGVPVLATLAAIAIYGSEALEAPRGGWAGALTDVLALFVIQFLLFQLAEEVGWTGFLQDRWQDRFSPIGLSARVAVLWALWHVPDFYVDEGLGLEQLIGSLVFLVIEIFALFFARVLIVWIYTHTGRSVLLVVMFHASFDATISELSTDVIPASDAVRFLILSAVVVLAATAVIVVTRGRFGRSPNSPRTA